MRKVNEYRPWKVTISTAAIFFFFFLAMIPMKVKLYILIYYGVREGTRKKGSVGH